MLVICWIIVLKEDILNIYNGPIKLYGLYKELDDTINTITIIDYINRVKIKYNAIYIVSDNMNMIFTYNNDMMTRNIINKVTGDNTICGENCDKIIMLRIKKICGDLRLLAIYNNYFLN